MRVVCNNTINLYILQNTTTYTTTVSYLLQVVNLAPILVMQTMLITSEKNIHIMPGERL